MKFFNKAKEKIIQPFYNYMSNFGSYSPDYANFSKYAYDNPFFSAPLNEIARCFNLAKIGVYTKNRKGEKIPVPNSNVLKWLENPNPELTQDQYNTYWILWYYIGGGLMMYKQKAITKANLYLYRPDSFRFKRNETNLQIEGIELGNTQIAGKELKNYKIVKAINIDDYIAGYGTEFRSPLRSLAMLGDMSNYAFKHQTNQLNNSGKRTGILEFKKFMDKRKKDEIQQEFNGLGKKGAGNVAMLNGENFKFHQMDLTPQEMDWLQSIKFVREVITSTIGVPIQLLSSEGTTYNNVKEFKKKIYGDVVIPLLEFYCNKHTQFLQEDLNEGEFIWFDTSEIKELQLDVSNIVKDLASGLIGQVTLNEFRQIVMNMTGIQFSPLPKGEGDVLLVKNNLTTIQELLVDDTSDKDE